MCRSVKTIDNGLTVSNLQMSSVHRTLQGQKNYDILLSIVGIISTGCLYKRVSSRYLDSFQRARHQALLVTANFLVSILVAAIASMIETTLHSKYVSPANLSMALTKLVGTFTVELRQNVYSIRSTKNFNVDELLESCGSCHLK
ncbi:hypothetical protein F4777DRAFT_532258 [Nemania sp. FL0916]|nr:hypothetical protein F4777DRAFT_532258 [Nemania sp. FL0916]